MAGAEEPPKRERTLYEIASSFFAVCVIVFAVAGMVASATGDEGIVSLPFAICVLFLLLGVGRLYLGWVRGNEGAEEPKRGPRPVQAVPSPGEAAQRPGEVGRPPQRPPERVARPPQPPRRGDH